MERQRLAALGISEPGNLVYAAIDFETDTLGNSLESVGFDFGVPTAFTWVGVTMYLTLPAIEATLETVARSAAGSVIVLTYDLPRSSLDQRSLALSNAVSNAAADMGEPFISLFEPLDAEALLCRLGFGRVQHFGPVEAIREYFGGDTTMWVGGPQRAVTAIVEPR